MGVRIDGHVHVGYGQSLDSHGIINLTIMVYATPLRNEREKETEKGVKKKDASHGGQTLHDPTITPQNS